MATKAVAPETRQLVRASVQGTVYLIDPIRGEVYSYNPEAPLFYGMLTRCDEKDKHMISKSDGCLAGCRVEFRSDLKDAIARHSHTPPVLSTA